MTETHTNSCVIYEKPDGVDIIQTISHVYSG